VSPVTPEPLAVKQIRYNRQRTQRVCVAYVGPTEVQAFYYRPRPSHLQQFGEWERTRVGWSKRAEFEQCYPIVEVSRG
jgi:hypothetical protein